MEYKDQIIKRNAVACAVVLLVLHLIYAGIDYYYNYISGDFTKEAVLGVLFYILNAISIVLIYFRFGVAVGAYRSYTPKKALPFAIICAISFFLSHFLEIFVYAISFSDFSQSPLPYILSAILSLLCDIIIMIIVILLTQLKKLKNAKVIFTAIICAVLYLMTLLTQTVYYTDFSTIDLTQILLDYVRPVVSAVVGVVVILITDKVLFAKKEKDEE